MRDNFLCRIFLCDCSIFFDCHKVHRVPYFMGEVKPIVQVYVFWGLGG